MWIDGSLAWKEITVYDFDEGHDHVDVVARVIHLTDKAALLRVGTDQQWVPKSLIEDPDTLAIGEEVTIGIEEWKVDELGW
ncbi:MAG: hypothetical protein ACM3X6_01370 [Patescibacteria group bacterium]